MSIYDHRGQPAYRPYKVEAQYAKNRRILKWWTTQHDQLLEEQISQWQWVWAWRIADEIIKVTPQDTLENWRNSDPLCKTYAWYNILMYFAEARAAYLEITRKIRRPEWKACPLCGHRFVEDSLPMPLIERLGINGLDYCAPCLRDTVLQGTGNDAASAASISKYLRSLAKTIERVPPQNFGEGVSDLHGLTSEERTALLRLLRRKPTVKRVKAVFGSWLHALVQSGVLESSTRRTSRGTHTIAKDGHVCLSLGEKTIDDFLHDRGLVHEKEPRYPEGRFRGDFEVRGAFVEYFGLVGNPEYDARMKEKMRICRKHGIKLISIYPQDLISPNKLEAKLAPIIVE